MDKYGVGEVFENRQGQRAIIIDTMAKKTKDPYDFKRGRRRVRFIETGYEKWVMYGEIKRKKFVDNSLLKYSLGKEFLNNQGHKAVIVGKNANTARTRYIRFKNTNTILEVELRNLLSGAFKDYKEPSVYGVGYSYKGAKEGNKKVYKLWSGMLERCYAKGGHVYKWYGGRGVRVADEWLHFKNFEEGIKELEGYDKFISDVGRVYSLDKDSKGQDNLYSKETCRFTDWYGQGEYKINVNKIESTSRDGIKTVHTNINQACRDLGVQNSNVYKVLNGERNHTLGYTFKRLYR